MTSQPTPDQETAQQHIVIFSDDELFELGQTHITGSALDALGLPAAAVLLSRHMAGDWGDLCDEDMDANLHALELGLRILSRYNTPVGDFYIITEWDRSYTTIMPVSEY
jgi:hypothetical protein